VRTHGLHITALSMLVFIGATLGGCSPKYSGGGGSEAISGSTEQICYEYQLPPPSSTSPRTPLFVVLWLAKKAGWTSMGPYGLLKIHGHPISPDLNKKAVYALQPDYSLKELSLTPAEIDQLFSHMQDAQVSRMQGRRLQDDEVFKTKVVSQLKNVESPD